MSLAFVLPAYCLLVLIASLVGGWLPSLIQLTHLRTQLMMSFVSGVMLGVAGLHMLPHSLEYLPGSWVGGSVVAGILVMFFLLRVFHVHSHGDHDHDHDHDTERAPDSHVHDVPHEHSHGSEPKHALSCVGLLFGLTIHSLLDGVAMASGAIADAQHQAAAFPVIGLGVFLAVLLHKPLDALVITSLMRTAGWSTRAHTIANSLFALSCPLGAFLFWLGSSQMAGQQNVFMGVALAFSAGFFLCIALSDLLPEVAFHSHDRVKLSVALLFGVSLAIGIESFHSHDHEPDKQLPAGHSESDDPHSGHSHPHDGHGH